MNILSRIAPDTTAMALDENYYMYSHEGYLIGAVFEGGTLGPLTHFAIAPGDCLTPVRALTEYECRTLASQPVLRWYELVHSQGITIALCRCRRDPYPAADTAYAVGGRGQVGV